MRLRKLASVLVTGVSLIALAPASASAFKHSSPTGRCRVGINVAPRQITAGDPVVIFGRLICRGRASDAGQVVKLFHRIPSAPGFSYVGSTTTDSNGFYEFARADGVVETNRAWFVRSHGAQSAHKAIKVAAQVTLAGPAEGTQILTGRANKVTFTGTVTPADVGARVILQRQNATTGSEWHRIDIGQVGAGGAYSIVHRFIVPGDANIRVLVRSQGRNVPSPSNVLAYDISQTQNSELTIDSSADPIEYGQSVTISGTLAGGASQPVTLLARTVRQTGFAPVAEITTDASGNYGFPAQSPVNSTFYKVTGAGKSSAVLYEGVKDVLTAAVSATTIEAGQSLTFSGAVAPSHAGHTIYLERQNASGQGFHVVEVSSVNPDSTYSIAHQVYDTGTKVFRIHIPGGPENQGAVSQPFTIQVTAAPAAALMPEAPAGATLPPEGQS
jgi:hypothetical protein